MGKTLTSKGIGAPDFVKELRAVIYNVASDKDTHFTGVIAKNGVERENITGLRSDRVRINKITIEADQQLLFEILLYATDLFEESDLDEDKFIGAVELDLPYYGIQSTDGQWIMDVKGVNLDYVDLDKTKEIHAVLKNLSPTSKSAWADGDIKIDFLCEARA